ncbi:MAG: hypothetical protein GY909_16150 [Oligoflexia bacterium]|nr:hypothetical protein [Oligoflexia bacterium]
MDISQFSSVELEKKIKLGELGYSVSQLPLLISKVDDENVLRVYLDQAPEDEYYNVLISLCLYQKFEILDEYLEKRNITIADYKYLFRVLVESKDKKSLEYFESKLPYFSNLGIDVAAIEDFTRLELLECCDIPKNIEHVTECIFGKCTSFRKKALLEKIFNNGESAPNTQILNYYFNFLKNLENKDLSAEFMLNISSNDLDKNLETFEHYWADFREISELYGRERMVILTKNSTYDKQTLYDTSSMLKRIKDLVKFMEDPEERAIYEGVNLRKILPGKPKTIAEIHDTLSAILSTLNSRPVKLSTKRVIHLDEMDVTDELRIVVPKNSRDLVRVGDLLNFCLGNGVYTEKINDAESSILIIEEKGVPKYALEAIGSHIVQAYGKSNSPVPSEKLNLIKEVFINNGGCK